MAKDIGKDYRNYTTNNEIKRLGEFNNLAKTELGDVDPYMLERLTQIKEDYMNKSRATITGTGILGAEMYKP